MFSFLPILIETGSLVVHVQKLYMNHSLTPNFEYKFNL